MPTLTDLGYQNLSTAIRHPHKKPKGGELAEAQTTYNKVIRPDPRPLSATAES